MIYYFTMMCISKKNVIEKVKNLTKTIKSDFTFESAVDSFINETFGDPLGNVNPDGVDYLLMDLSHDIEDIRKFFNDDQYDILIRKLEFWQYRYQEERDL